jgi:hypothetical protein
MGYEVSSWGTCDCGGLKPKGAQCCWRCIERDEAFSRLDALIAAGWGSVEQSLIPWEVMNRCATHDSKTAWETALRSEAKVTISAELLSVLSEVECGPGAGVL